jgi:hypothetical protein
MSGIRIIGNVTIRHYRRGKLLSEQHPHNLVVNQGLTMISQKVHTSTEAAFWRIAYGTDNTAPDPTDTALGSQSQITAGACDTSGRVGAVYTASHTFTAAGTETAYEAGLFAANAGPDMFSRVTFAGISLVLNDELFVEFEYTATDGTP